MMLEINYKFRMKMFLWYVVILCNRDEVFLYINFMRDFGYMYKCFIIFLLIECNI